MSRNASEILTIAMEQRRHVCVGLDSDDEKVPPYLASVLDRPQQILMFNAAIVDATHNIAGAFKPNLAFYAKLGADGIRILEQTCQYIRTVAPHTLIILDAKYGDIGNTNLGYTTMAFERCGADAVTLHPYMGEESLLPFLERTDKLSIILSKTSNKGSKEFQDREVFLTDDEESWARGVHISLQHNGYPRPSMPLYQLVAFRVAQLWSARTRCGLVVGATYPKELSRVRTVAPHSLILAPGYGAQKGDLEATVLAAAGEKRTAPFLVNSARGIIFASSKKDFAEAAGHAAYALDRAIRRALEVL